MTPRSKTIPTVTVDPETAQLMQQIYSMGEAPSDDLLAKLIPDRDDFVAFLKDRGMENLEPARQLVAQLDSMRAKVGASTEQRPEASGRLERSRLVVEMAKRLALTPTQSASLFELLAALAVREIRVNGEFTIPGIGKLVRSERRAPAGRNPETGEAVKSEGETVVKFKPAKSAQMAFEKEKL